MASGETRTTGLRTTLRIGAVTLLCVLTGGWTLARVTAQAPASAAANAPTRYWSLMAASSVKKTAAIMAMPPERPSMLSSKFNALVMPITQTSVVTMSSQL